MLFYEHKDSKEVVKAISSADSKNAHAFDSKGDEKILPVAQFSAQYDLLNPQPVDFPVAEVAAAPDPEVKKSKKDLA